MWISCSCISRVRCDFAVLTIIPNSTPISFEQTAAAQSVSGKIASVEKTSFTPTVGAGYAMSNPGHQLQESSPKSMTFRIDKNTTVDGKLQVGAKAEVTYREESGKFVVISVRDF